ncbi:MAG: C25 family cysteine peptidase, partial [Rubripirellula sp.]|nr:C25 family cysteine peptidase [Rubripirellula sp.]
MSQLAILGTRSSGIRLAFLLTVLGAGIGVPSQSEAQSKTQSKAQSASQSANPLAGSPTQSSGQVVVVCGESFREAVSSWIDFRLHQGMLVEVISPKADAASTKEAVRDAFTRLSSAGADAGFEKTLSPTPAGRVVDPAGRVLGLSPKRYLLLVGDTPVIGTRCDVKNQVPTFYVPSKVTEKWGSTPTLPTDFPYADLDGGGGPEIAVGRLPVDNASQFTRWLERLKQREGSSDFGPWRTEVQLVGGVGGFGFVADRAIEAVARTVVTGVLPSAVRTHVLYGSPGHRFYPSTDTFTQAVVSQFSQGCRFWVYAGHGQVTALDRVPPGRDGIPVLDRASVQRLKCEAGQSPVALLLACYTAATDAAEDSLAESLLLAPGGPVAVIGGSRVTMPYGNAALAVELIHAIYGEEHHSLGDQWLSTQRSLLQSARFAGNDSAQGSDAQGSDAQGSDAQGSNTANDDVSRDGTSLGDEAKAAATNGERPVEDRVLDQSARVMIDGLASLLSPPGFSLLEERIEHVQLYGLLGDPTQRMIQPEALMISVPAGIDAGGSVNPIVKSPITGTLMLRIDRPLGASFKGDPNETLIGAFET